MPTTAVTIGASTPLPTPPQPTPPPSSPTPDKPIRYMLALTARMPKEAAQRDVVLLIDGRRHSLIPGKETLLQAEPGVALTLVLPEGYPLQLKKPETAFAQPAGQLGSYLLQPAAEDFKPVAPSADGPPVHVARAQLMFTPAQRAPRLTITPRNGVVESGKTIRQVLAIANQSLLAQDVEVRYLPNSARFAPIDAKAAGYDRRLADGTLCWTRTLPPAAWKDDGTVIPSTTSIILEQTALPLTRGAGFADAEAAWQLLWHGGVRRGVWNTQIVAPRIHAELSADHKTAEPGDQITFTVRVSNRGGADKTVTISTVLPTGFRYRAGQGGEPAPKAAGDMLLWELYVPAASPAKPGQEQSAIGQAELRYVLQMEARALDQDEGWRAMDFVGWADGIRMHSAQIKLLASRIHARQELSVTEALAGDEVTLRTVFENSGGAEGTVTWIQTLPDGLAYIPDPNERHPRVIDAQGRLVWTVVISPAAQAQGGVTRPGVAQRSVTFRLAEALAAEHTGGRRLLQLPATVNLQALPVQTLRALCPDVTVQAVAEQSTVTPGALCVMTLRITNRGLAGAPLTLGVDIPEGFVPAEGQQHIAGLKATVEGRTLRWRLDVPPAQAGAPAIIEVLYPLRAAPLAQGSATRTSVHGAHFTVAGGPMREALTAEVKVAHRNLFANLPIGFWLFAPLTSLLLCAAVVLIILYRGRGDAA